MRSHMWVYTSQPNSCHLEYRLCVHISVSFPWQQGHVIPVIFILLFWPSIEVARSCSVVKHREVPQVWEAGGYFLNENGEIGDIVFVHPQGLQFWHRGEDDVWTKFITVQDKCCEICQSAERVNVTESVREKSEDSERKNTSLYLAIECVNVHLQKTVTWLLHSVILKTDLVCNLVEAWMVKPLSAGCVNTVVACWNWLHPITKLTHMGTRNRAISSLLVEWPALATGSGSLVP